MQRRKFMMWVITALISPCGFFVSGMAMAGILPPTSCGTFTGFNSNGTPDLSNVNNNPVISIDNTGQWPVVIDNPSADIENVCDNSFVGNYPCTVFKYRINDRNVNYQHMIITVPTCLDNSMDLAKYSATPTCGDIVNSQGNPEWTSLACSMRNIRVGKSNSFSIPVKGKNVGIGVISWTLVNNSATPNINYYCYNVETRSGILGPACGAPNTCPPSEFTPKLKALCTSIEGSTYRISYGPGTNGLASAFKIEDCGSSDPECAGQNCLDITETTPSYPLDDVCLIFENNPTHCYSVEEIGSSTGDANTQTGYASYADSPGCVTMLIGGKLTLVGTTCPR